MILSSFYLLFLSLACVSASSLLLDGGTIVTFDNATQAVKVMRKHSILIHEDRISAIFSAEDRPPLPPHTRIIEVKDKIISPGFIDTHRHLFQSAFKTIGSNITMATYFATMSPFVPSVIERLSADDIYYGQLFGIRESLAAGVTSIVDHSYGTFDEATSEASLRASIDTGARIYWCFGLHQIPNNFTVPNQIETFKRLTRTIDWSKTPVRPGISYDEFANGPSEELNQVTSFLRNANISLISTHFLGGPWIAANSPTLLQTLDLVNGSIPIVFAHSTGLSPDDAQVLRQHDHYISIAAESEMHFGHGFPHAHKIMDKASLGIDASWAWSGDLVTQARIWLQTVRLREYQKALDEWTIPANSPMSVNQAFLLATKNGARALRRYDLGVLQVGAKADIVVFDGTASNLLGWNDPVAAIVLHSHPGNVQHVLVDGQFRKFDFKLTQFENPSRNLDDAQERFLESANRLQHQFLGDPVVDLEGEHRAGVPYVHLQVANLRTGDAGTGY